MSSPLGFFCSRSRARVGSFTLPRPPRGVVIEIKIGFVFKILYFFVFVSKYEKSCEGIVYGPAFINWSMNSKNTMLALMLL